MKSREEENVKGVKIMRHGELRTTPRDDEVTVRTRHGRKHGKHEIVRHDPVTAVERREPVRLHDLFESMERLMEEAWHRPMFGFGLPMMRTLFPEWTGVERRLPVTDIFEENGTMVVKAELPGIPKEDVKVTLEGNRLVITADNRTEERAEEKEYIRVERRHGRFERVLTLPEGLDLDNVAATMKDGVLEVRIPKNRGEEARTITVT